MEYTVEVDMPNLPKGVPVEVPPIGMVENGGSKSVEMDEETADHLATAYGVTVKGSGNTTSRSKKKGEGEGVETK